MSHIPAFLLLLQYRGKKSTLVITPRDMVNIYEPQCQFVLSHLLKKETKWENLRLTSQMTVRTSAHFSWQDQFHFCKLTNTKQTSVSSSRFGYFVITFAKQGKNTIRATWYPSTILLFWKLKTCHCYHTLYSMHLCSIYILRASTEVWKRLSLRLVIIWLWLGITICFLTTIFDSSLFLASNNLLTE